MRTAELLPFRAMLADRYNPKTHMAAFSAAKGEIVASSLITRVFRHSDGGVRVEVHSTHWTTFEYIYRDGSSVRWDEASASFYVIPSARLSPADSFRQILKAVQSEYGEILKLAESTQFDGLPEELVLEILSGTPNTNS